VTSKFSPLRPLKINKPWTPSITGLAEDVAGEDSADLADATTTVETYKVGTLVVDLFDAKTEKLIWRSSSSDTLSDKADKHQESRQRREQNVPAIFLPRRRSQTSEAEMNRYLTFSLAISVTLSTLAIPYARQTSRARGGWKRPLWYGRTKTSRDSEPGLISVVVNPPL